VNHFTRTPSQELAQSVPLAYGEQTNRNSWEVAMETRISPPSHAADRRWQHLHADRRFRGLRVEENLFTSLTMYIVELDQLGLFISDSRAAALDMACEALSIPQPMPG